MPMKKRVLLYEPSHTGHHLKYVQLLVRAFAGREKDVVFASAPASFASVEYATLLQSWEHLFTPVVLDEGRAGRRLRLWRNLRQMLAVAERCGCQHIFLPYLDTYFRRLGLLAGVRPAARRTRLEGILLDGACSFDRAPKGVGDRMRRFIVKTILTRGVFHRVLFLDEAIHDSYVRHVVGTRTRLELCPDPVETDHSIPAEEFRTRFGLEPDAQVLGMFGMIDSSKGVDRLIDAFEQHRPRPQEYLFFMGRHTPAVLDHIRRSRAAAHIVSVDRFVTDDELISGIHAVDVVASLYPRHVTSASMVIRAAAAGKPTLGSDLGWTGRTIQKYGLGMVCDPLNEASLLQGIRWAFGCPRLDRQKADLFAGQNSVEHFTEVICQSMG
jgi:glycosyltransferase involved in cell wall biosynthesis